MSNFHSAPVPVLAVINGVPTTTTHDIARVYGKQHAKVLAIVRQRMSECPLDWCLANFGEASVELPQPNGGTVSYPVIRLSKKGFHFVVGKFTGAKAVQHQIAFADEFERMEAELARRAQALLAVPVAAPALPRPPIRRREHLSFTRFDAESRLTNWVVEPRERLWGDTAPATSGWPPAPSWPYHHRALPRRPRRPQHLLAQDQRRDVGRGREASRAYRRNVDGNWRAWCWWDKGARI